MAGASLISVKLDVWTLMAYVTAIVFFTVFLERLLEILRWYLTQKGLDVFVAVINKVTGELMILGLISFGVLMAIEFFSEDPFVKANLVMFELAHVWIFCVGLGFGALAVVWMTIVTVYEQRWLAMDHMNDDVVMASMLSMTVRDGTRCGRCVNALCGVSLWQSRAAQVVEFQLLREFFIAKFGHHIVDIYGRLAPTRSRVHTVFKFGRYLNRVANEKVEEQMEVAAGSWAFFAVVLTVSAGATSVATTGYAQQSLRIAMLVLSWISLLCVIAMMIIMRLIRAWSTDSAAVALGFAPRSKPYDVVREIIVRNTQGQFASIKKGHGGGGHGGGGHGAGGFAKRFKAQVAIARQATVDFDESERSGYRDILPGLGRLQHQELPAMRKLTGGRFGRGRTRYMIAAMCKCTPMKRVRFFAFNIPYVSERFTLFQLCILMYVFIIGLPEGLGERKGLNYAKKSGHDAASGVLVYIAMSVIPNLVSLLILQPIMLKDIILVQSIVGKKYETRHVLHEERDQILKEKRLEKLLIRLVVRHGDSKVNFLFEGQDFVKRPSVWRCLRRSKWIDLASTEDHLSFRDATASRLHDMWRTGRKTMPDGRFEPRFKMVDAASYDIANLSFVELPQELQQSNVEAAHCACGLVALAAKRGSTFDTDFFEWAAAKQHDDWIEHNRAWADPSQLEPYYRLSDFEKEKDRTIVRVAVVIWERKHTAKNVAATNVITMQMFGKALHHWGLTCIGSDLKAIWGLVSHGGEATCVTIRRIQELVNKSLVARSAKRKLKKGMLVFRSEMRKLNSARDAIDMADLALRRAMQSGALVAAIESACTDGVHAHEFERKISDALLQTVTEQVADFEHQLEVEEILKSDIVQATYGNVMVEGGANRGREAAPMVSSADRATRVARLSVVGGRAGANGAGSAADAAARAVREVEMSQVTQGPLPTLTVLTQVV